MGFLLCDASKFPFPWALLPVAGTVALIYAETMPGDSPSQVDRILRAPAMVFLGRLSYSLYLWHWPVFVLFRWTVGLENALPLVLALTLSFALAVASFYLVERPFQNAAILRRLPRLVVVLLGLVAIYGSWRLARKIFNERPRISLSVTRDSRLWFPDPRETGSRDSGLGPRIGSRDLPRVYELTLHPSAGPKPNAPRIFVLGDSHAGAYRAMLQDYGERRHLDIILYFQGGCSLGNLLDPVSEMSPRCQEFARSAEQQLDLQVRPGDVVFLASLKMVRLSDQWVVYDSIRVDSLRNSLTAGRHRSLAMADLEGLVRLIGSKGAAVVIDGPKPIFRAPPLRCSDWFNARNPICAEGFEISADRLRAHAQYATDSLRALAARVGHLVVWEPFPVLCPGTVCSAFRGGKPLFLDADHLSGYGNDVLLPDFSRVVDSMLTSDGTGARGSRE